MAKKIILLIALSYFSFRQVQGQSDRMVDTAQYLISIKHDLTTVWPKNRTINLVFHGHSVVAGYQDNHEVHTFESYPFFLFKKLKKKYPYAVINVIVTAIGGENSVQGEKRFEKDVLTHQPDVLFIDYSLNDRGPGLEKAKEAWEKMIEAALKKNIKIILLTPSPDERVDILSPGNPLELHADQIRQLAMKYHIGLSDPFSRFKTLEKEGGTIKDYMSMFVHPNKKGNEIIANELMKWF